jgi:tetratricopeptide (TPR) repeat protein
MAGKRWMALPGIKELMANTDLPDFDTMWDYDDPAGTEQHFADLLPRAQTSGDAAYYLELMTQLARTQGLQRQFDRAHATLDYVEKLLEDLPPRVMVRYLLERGRVFRSSKQRDAARPYFLEAWNIASAAGEDIFAIDAAHMMALVEPPENQLDWNLRGLQVAENSPDPKARSWMGSLYNNIGWAYHEQWQYEEALRTFVKTLAYYESQNEPQWARVARWSIGRVLRSLGRYEEALKLQRDVQTQADAAGESDGYAAEEIGECLLALGRDDEARSSFARAYDVLSADAWLVDNEPDRLARLSALGGAGD